MIGWLEQEGKVKQMSLILRDIRLQSVRTRLIFVEYLSDVRRDKIARVEVEFISLFV